MDKTDYEHLEILLGKLMAELDGRICIIPYHMGDCAYIGIYNHNGNMRKQTNGVDLEDCVIKLKK